MRNRTSRSSSPPPGSSRRRMPAGISIVLAVAMFGTGASAAGENAAPAVPAGKAVAPANAAPRKAAGSAPIPAPAPGDANTGDSGIEITSTASSWDNLSDLFLGSTPAAPFAEGSMFVMRGELRNRSDKPVRYVVLRYELLDDKGKVLHDVEGYNRSAEAMRPDEEGNVHAEQVHSIPAGGVDSYRMVFFHDEVPHFASQRVRVSEVHAESK